MARGLATWVFKSFRLIQHLQSFNQFLTDFHSNFLPGLLQRKQAVLYLKSEPPIVQASWLKLSSPIQNEGFRIIQDLVLAEEQKEFNLIQNLNFGASVTAWFFHSIFFR